MKNICKILSVSVSVLFISQAFAKNYLDDNLRKLKWNGIDVVWLEDDALPTYDVSIYFNEGALGDNKRLSGETELMFEQLSSGTRRYTQSEIVEALEYYGAHYSSRVTHEYSTFSVGGMVKDFVPTMKMICHVFNNSVFPKSELKKAKSRIVGGMKSIVSNHSSLASRAFRYESLLGTGFETPTSGTIKTLKRMTSSVLQKRLKYFNETAEKRIYIKGPKDIKQLQFIINNDCKWKKTANIRTIPKVKTWRPNNGNEIVFVPVANANQAQVRIGRVMHTSEVREKNQDLKTFTSNFLGSGFTSRLFQKLRVQKGLTYTVSSYTSNQFNYGRSGISTFTKNETIVELLSSIQEVLTEAQTKIDKDGFALSKKSIKGNYLIGLESTSDFLHNLLHFDHVERNYADIYKFTSSIDKLTIDDLKKMAGQIFGWDKQTVLVLGNKSLIPVLKKAGYKIRQEKVSKYL